MAKKYKANYNTANPTYLDYLLALRKVFTNDADIIPIIYEFNFYINGVFSTPYVDLFRMYDDNIEDIHGPEKTKQLINDGSIGVINNEIYKSNGSLLSSLESLRVYLLNRSNKYNIGYNPMTNTYTEALKTVVNVLPEANPQISQMGNVFLTQAQLEAKTANDEIKRAGGGPIDEKFAKKKTKIIKKNPLKILFNKLGILLNKKKKVETETEKRIRSTEEYYKNLQK
jgi:hypothetical protein